MASCAVLRAAAGIGRPVCEGDVIVPRRLTARAYQRVMESWQAYEKNPAAMKNSRSKRLTFIPRMIIIRASWLIRGASSGDGPVGRSRERFPAAPARNRPRGRRSLPLSPPENGELEGASRNAAVERREARRPDHKGRKDASPASSRASLARKVPNRHLRFSVLHSPSLAQSSEERGEGNRTITARPAALSTRPAKLCSQRTEVGGRRTDDR
jgi:hypothetical protein